MLIYLLGLPGSGKTTLGRPLAESLGIDFKDMDDIIEAKEQMSIPTIFSTKGEEYFRRVENEVLKEISCLNDCVISTGGGVPCFHNNIEIINQTGLSIFIDVSPKEIARRLLSHQSAIHNRPLLNSVENAGLFTEISEKLRTREEYYSKSTLRLKSDNLSSDIILEAVSNWSKSQKTD